MRIGIISTMSGGPWGGSEELWADTAHLALRAGLRVSICLPFRPRPSHKKWEALEAAGAETFCYRIARRYIRARQFARLVGTLHQDLGGQLRQRLSPLPAFFSTQPDVLLISEGGSIPPVAVIDSVRQLHIPKPYVILSESNFGEIPETTARRQAAAFYKGARSALFVSESNRRDTERQLIQRLSNARVVRNPINLKCIDPVPWPAGRLLCFASIARLNASAKGQDILFEVLNDRRWRDRDWRLSIYGRGVEENYFQELSAFYGLDKRVTFRGQTEDIRGVWHTHHALVLPSRVEGTPLAMVEAMLCARPIIGTAVAGIPEWVRHGHSGFIADAPTVSSYSAALETAWQQRVHWPAIGTHAREDALRWYDPSPEQTLLNILTESVSTHEKVRSGIGESAITSLDSVKPRERHSSRPGLPLLRSPVTGSENVTLLETIPAERLIAWWQSEFSIDVTNQFHEVFNIWKYRCNDSELICFGPDSVAGIDSLYQQLQRFPWYYENDKWEYQIARRDLRRSKSVFEFGCGTGGFLNLLAHDGHEVAGVELNQHAAAQAREAGLNVCGTSAAELTGKLEGAYDAVCSFQVLEHVPNPGGFIREAIKREKRGGKVLFAVPNSAGFEGLGYDLLQYPPHHMSWWTPNCFRALQEFFPLRLEKLLNEPLARAHIDNYLAWNACHWRQRSSRYRLLFNRITLPIYRRGLAQGLRRFWTGHSLYAQFTRL